MDKYPHIDDPDFQFLIARRLEFKNLVNSDGLYPHQEFVRRFLSPYTPYDSLIMYHSLGSGKSIACIAVAVDHYLHDGKKCIIVTKGNSGTNNFEKQIQMYCDMSSRKDEWNISIFVMRHYISLSNQIGNMSDDDVAKAFSDSIIVLDEVHNVRYLRNANEHSVYGSIIRLLKLCTNVKVIIATATPMTDSPEQINSLLGICNHSRDPANKLSMNGIVSYNSTICDKPESSHIGTEDFVPGVRVYPSDMVGHQKNAYDEENGVQPPDDIYRKLTHISLFCFEDGTYGKDVTDFKMTRTRMKNTITSMSTKHTREIKYVKYNIVPQFAHMLVGKNLRNSSCKYSKVIELISVSKGNIFIFLEEVKGSGLLLLASILEQHGYELYIGEDLKNMSKKKRYTMCVGSSEICPNNADRLDGFNSDVNKNGEYVHILLGSKVIGESITLKNVRSFYCLTPHWNDSTVDQAIGRVVRNGSHSMLDEEQRNVDIYILVSIFPDDPRSSVDIKKLTKCKEKEKDIRLVELQMIDLAVDRYKDDPNLPITEVSNFAAAYLHHHMDALFAEIKSYFYNKPRNLWEQGFNVYDMADALNVHPVLFQEAMCRIIYSNMAIAAPKNMRQQNTLCKYFFRAYADKVFVVADPSLPFVMIPEADYDKKPSGFFQEQGELEPDYIGLDDIGTFRYMHVQQKAAFVENCISQGRHDVLERLHLDTLYANVNINDANVVCHLLLYRDLESSYTSSNPVPKRPGGRTRIYTAGTWSTLKNVATEQYVFDCYRPLVNEAIHQADETWSIYGLISTIDGDMRLRLRDKEDTVKSSIDSRYVRRGKNMVSIKKEYLSQVLDYLQSAPERTSAEQQPVAQKPAFDYSCLVEDYIALLLKDTPKYEKAKNTAMAALSEQKGTNMSIIEMARRIDEALVNAGSYIVI